jgi:hypothetical protein
MTRGPHMTVVSLCALPIDHSCGVCVGGRGESESEFFLLEGVFCTAPFFHSLRSPVGAFLSVLQYHLNDGRRNQRS